MKINLNIQRLILSAIMLLLLFTTDSNTVLACTGISLIAKDGSYIQARTIEWAHGVLPCSYVIIPRGERLTSLTPTGKTGATYCAKYGVVGLAVVQKEFIAEGINEKGLSAGLFFFPAYGSYNSYSPALRGKTVVDLQFVQWILSRFSTIDEVQAAVEEMRIVGLDPASVLHWRIGEPNGRQVVLEIVNGIPHFYENRIGVLTNAPGFEWHITNLSNYVNLYQGDAPTQMLGKQTVRPLGGNSGFLGIPGDATPPSRFVRAAFYKATAPVRERAFDAVQQCFHILNNFDIPIGIELSASEIAGNLNSSNGSNSSDNNTALADRAGKAADRAALNAAAAQYGVSTSNISGVPSATQWTSAIDLTNLKVYYKTAYNNTIRCIDLHSIDFKTVKYQSAPLDKEQVQPVENIAIH